MRTVHYPSDLTREQWEFIRVIIPKTRRGRPRKVSLKSVVDAILYLHHTGCQWAYLPKSYPNWKTVYYYFSKWSKEKFWEKLCHKLHALVRVKSKRSVYPHLGIIDAQSIRAPRGESRAYDGFKRVMGRKRNIMVDVLGIILSCKVHAADQQETITGKEVLDRLPPAIDENLETVLGDKGYRGGFREYAETYHGIKFNVVDHTPKRWIVERTFAWLMHYRRMSRDYEHMTRNSESMLFISMLPILTHRLTG